jgi:MoaA/NifB/PqqE/SkfB family radical SAM enzyme
MSLLFPLFDDVALAAEPAPERLTELHLYTGARCNRSCAFCCVEGSPKGGYAPFTEATLRIAVEIVAPRGSLKIYGGEPTLDAENLQWSIRTLRTFGFGGAVTVFSNGIRARALLAALESDPLQNCRAVLNYSIATGRGERPLPPASLRLLRDYACTHPDRIYLSHDFIIPVGRQAQGSAYAEYNAAPARCFHCHPVLTSQGEFHACPFAVEHKLPHFHLGTDQTPAFQVRTAFVQFQEWVTHALEPEAARRGANACRVCLSEERQAFPVPEAMRA